MNFGKEEFSNTLERSAQKGRARTITNVALATRAIEPSINLQLQSKGKATKRNPTSSQCQWLMEKRIKREEKRRRITSARSCSTNASPLMGNWVLWCKSAHKSNVFHFVVNCSHFHYFGGRNLEQNWVNFRFYLSVTNQFWSIHSSSCYLESWEPLPSAC